MHIRITQNLRRRNIFIKGGVGGKIASQEIALRNLRIIDLKQLGYSSREISEQMGVTIRTVDRVWGEHNEKCDE